MDLKKGALAMGRRFHVWQAEEEETGGQRK